jgi:hypothetical protein
MDVEYSKDVKHLIDDIEKTYYENIHISKRHAKKEAINKAIESVNNIIVKKRSNVSGEKKSNKRSTTFHSMAAEDEDDSKMDSASSDEEGGFEDYLFATSKLNLLKKAIKEEKDNKMAKGDNNIEIVEILIQALTKESKKFHRHKTGVSIGKFGGTKNKRKCRDNRKTKRRK